MRHYTYRVYLHISHNYRNKKWPLPWEQLSNLDSRGRLVSFMSWLQILHIMSHKSGLSQLCYGCFGCGESLERKVLSHRLLEKINFQSIFILPFLISTQTRTRGYCLGPVRDIEVSLLHLINVVSPATCHLCSFFFFFLVCSLFSKRLWTLLICSIWRLLCLLATEY